MTNAHEPRDDYRGRRFGRWAVLQLGVRIGNAGQPYWRCRCDCGTVKEVQQYNLSAGQSPSCGCLSKERMRAMRTTHGETIGEKGERGRTKEYRAWSHIKSRCYNPKVPCYPRYGGRGIRVCDEWLGSFTAFLRNVGRAPSPKHSIDRVDNARGYEPGNVRWATATEQSRNRRPRSCWKHGYTPKHQRR